MCGDHCPDGKSAAKAPECTALSETGRTRLTREWRCQAGHELQPPPRGVDTAHRPGNSSERCPASTRDNGVGLHAFEFLPPPIKSIEPHQRAPLGNFAFSACVQAPQDRLGQRENAEPVAKKPNAVFRCTHACRQSFGAKTLGTGIHGTGCFAATARVCRLASPFYRRARIRSPGVVPARYRAAVQGSRFRTRVHPAARCRSGPVRSSRVVRHRGKIYATRSRGSCSARKAPRFSSTRRPMATRVSVDVLPRCGSRTEFSRSISA